MPIYPLTIDRIVRRVRENTCTSELPPEAVAEALSIIASASPWRRRGCAAWTEHEWTREVRVRAGRDALRGRYEVVRLACGRCGLETSETRWPDLPQIPLPTHYGEEN